MFYLKIHDQIKRFKSFWNSPFGPVCTISLILAILGTFAINITLPIFGLMLIASAPWLISKILEMELPGGFKIKMKDLEEYTEKAKEAGLYSENNIEQPSFVTQQDPNLAMAGLRIEIEKHLRKFAEIIELDLSPNLKMTKIVSLRKLSEELMKSGFINSEEYSLLMDLIPTLNRAVHGETVTKEASEWVVKDGSKILAAINEKIKKFEDSRDS